MLSTWDQCSLLVTSGTPIDGWQPSSSRRLRSSEGAYFDIPFHLLAVVVTDILQMPLKGHKGRRDQAELRGTEILLDCWRSRRRVRSVALVCLLLRSNN